MPIPDYQSIMLPLLRLAGDDQEHSARQAVEALANETTSTSQAATTTPPFEVVLFVQRTENLPAEFRWAATQTQKVRP